MATETRKLVMSQINPILILNNTLEIGSFLKNKSMKADFCEQHLVPSTFTLRGAESLDYELITPTQKEPFARIKILGPPAKRLRIVKLQLTAVYVDAGEPLTATTNLFACMSETLESDDQALIVYGADQNVYFVDMSVDGGWQLTLLGSRQDLDPGAAILVQDGTTATWLQPEDPALIWCYVLNMKALSATRPPPK